MGKNGISGTGVVALTAGAILAWSALKGRAWSKTLRDLIGGSTPLDSQDFPINMSSATTGTSSTGVATGPGKQVCASEFGGPGDPGTGTHGYHGDDLRGKMAYAELSMGTALGGLPYKQRARITYNGKSVIAEKLDIGLGGKGCGGFKRGVDLWYETAQAIGFSGLGVVTFEVIQ